MMFQKNLAQEEAVQTHNGPVLLVSCPGSGKTTTMLRRINSMITSGIQASSIVMVTFTDAAAQEMKARYIKEYGECCVAFCTIHSMCLRILKEYSDVPVNVIPAEFNMDCSDSAFVKSAYHTETRKCSRVHLQILAPAPTAVMNQACFIRLPLIRTFFRRSLRHIRKQNAKPDTLVLTICSAYAEICFAPTAPF